MFAIHFRVRYSDVDERRVVNNARYLNYFEDARMGLLDEMFETTGADFRGKLIVAHASCDYLKPLVLRDHVTVAAGIQRMGTSSFDVGYHIKNQPGDAIATGHTTQVHFNYQTRQSQSLTDLQRGALDRYPFYAA